MHVVGHQHIGMDRDTMPPAHIAEAIQKESMIGVGQKYWRAIIPPLDEVLRTTRNKGSWGSWHLS